MPEGLFRWFVKEQFDGREAKRMYIVRRRTIVVFPAMQEFVMGKLTAGSMYMMNK